MSTLTWITNTTGSQAEADRAREASRLNVDITQVVIGDPAETESFTVPVLQKIGMVGIYLRED